jgi:hypothetical protein
LDEAVDLAMAGKGLIDDDINMKLELSFFCENLPNMDTTSLTDSACVVYMLHGEKWDRVGETEVITDNLNPKFVKSVVINYCFEEKQLIKVKVFDVDDFREGVDVAQNPIGEVQFYAHEILKTKSAKLVLGLTNEKTNKAMGKIHISGEEKKRGTKLSYKMKLKVTGFSNYKKIFYRLCRFKDSTTFIPVYESETCSVNEATKDYLFKVADLWEYALNRNNPDQKIQIQFFQFRKNGDHALIGSSVFVAEDITQHKKIPIANPKNEPAILEAALIEVNEKFTFLDYVFSGLEISLVIGIDFTRSNGDPSNPNSKHYFNYGTSIISHQSISPSDKLCWKNIRKL